MEIYDTSLRDGTQSSDINLTMHDKLKIVKLLDDLMIDYIELGWPGSNIKDKEAFQEVSRLKLKHAKICAFGSTRRAKIKAEDDNNLNAILESGVEIACIFGKTWEPHIVNQLNISLKKNLKLIEESIVYLKKNKLRVFYDLEHFFDGFKENRDYALECLKRAANAGAEYLILCDTNGGCLPNEIFNITKETYQFLEKNKLNSKLGIHCHNDSGCGVANSIISAPFVEQIQGTINGYGERAGNADLCQILPNLKYKLKIIINQDLKKLKELSEEVNLLCNLEPDKKQPYVGENAFVHKGGLHVDAITKGASYEHLDPKLVGNVRDIVLSDLSGKTNVVEMLKKYNINVDKENPNVGKLLEEIKNLEKKGYNIGLLEAELFLLANKYFQARKECFLVDEWYVTSGKINKKERSRCSIIGNVDGKNKKVVSAVYGGPVDAQYRALQKMIATNYKEIKDVKLVNYKVMIAEDKGPESSVRTYIEFKNHDKEWSTVGVSENILEASFEAIKKGFSYFLLQKDL